MPGILLDGLRRSSVALDAKAKNKKGGKGEAKAGKDKQAPGAMPAGEKAPKMKKENTDVTGEDPQEIIANVKDKMGKTVENTREALGAIRVDPEARRGHWTRIDEEGELAFALSQTLIDEEGEGAATIEARVELLEPRMPAGPMLRIIAIRD